MDSLKVSSERVRNCVSNLRGSTIKYNCKLAFKI